MIKRENKDLKYENYELKKDQRPLKEKIEAKTKVFRKLEEEYSNKCENYNYIKKQLASTTVSLTYWKTILKMQILISEKMMCQVR